MATQLRPILRSPAYRSLPAPSEHLRALFCRRVCLAPTALRARSRTGRACLGLQPAMVDRARAELMGLPREVVVRACEARPTTQVPLVSLELPTVLETLPLA